MARYQLVSSCIQPPMNSWFDAELASGGLSGFMWSCEIWMTIASTAAINTNSSAGFTHVGDDFDRGSRAAARGDDDRATVTAPPSCLRASGRDEAADSDSEPGLECPNDGERGPGEPEVGRLAVVQQRPIGRRRRGGGNHGVGESGD